LFGRGRLRPKGKPPANVENYIYGPFSTSRSVMNYDSANDVAILLYHGNVSPEDTGKRGRGVYIYDPAADSWGEAPLAVTKEYCKCPSSLYDPELKQVGIEDEATASLTRLRRVMKQARWAKDAETHGFVREAENLIQGNLRD
jgi:hypothetical protein